VLGIQISRTINHRIINGQAMTISRSAPVGGRSELRSELRTDDGPESVLDWLALRRPNEESQKVDAPQRPKAKVAEPLAPPAAPPPIIEQQAVPLP
jgi:hypothetical protein